MSRSRWRRAGPRRGSRRTARRALSPTGSPAQLPRHELQPDAGAHLGDGVVVETRLVARLLGLRVLRVDGTVRLAPARVVERGPVVVVPPDGAAAPTTGTPTGVGYGPLGGELARAADLLRGLDSRGSRD